MPKNGGGVGKRVGIKERRERRTRFFLLPRSLLHTSSYKHMFRDKERKYRLIKSLLMKKFRHYLLPHTFVIGEEISNFQAVGSQFNKGRVFYQNFAQTERIVKLR